MPWVYSVLLSILVTSVFLNIFINSNIIYYNAEILQLFGPMLILGGYIKYFFCRTVLEDFFL